MEDLTDALEEVVSLVEVDSSEAPADALEELAVDTFEKIMMNMLVLAEKKML